MKISSGTIVRTIMLALVLLNLILKQTGRPILEIQEGTVQSLVETIIEITAICAAWWKNNSFTQNAKKADAYLRALNEGDKNEGKNTVVANMK